MTQIKSRNFKTRLWDAGINMNVNKFETFTSVNNVNVNKINDIYFYLYDKT